LGQLPEAVVSPAFVVICGLPGTGKSYFCHRLAERLPFAVLESDALRKVLFSSPSYSAEESSCLFRSCHLLIEELLREGIHLILDATNLSESRRERLGHIASRLEARLIMVGVEAPPSLVRQRLRVRGEGNDLQNSSDADWNVYQRMKASVQRIRRNYFAVDTSGDISPVIDKIARAVGR
jgi:predicted kinase